MKIIFYFSLVLLFSSFQSFAGEIIKTKYSYVIDKESVLDISTVKNKVFQKIKWEEDINVGYNENDAVWCKVELQNIGKNKTIYIDLANIQLDSIQLFDLNKITTQGDRTTINSPFFQSHTFKISLKANQTKVLYFRVKKTICFFNFSIRIRNLNDLKSETFTSMFSIAILLGIGFILFVFNLLIFRFTKSKINLYYLFYSVTSIAYVLITTGFLKHFFFPNFLYISELRIYSGSLWFLFLSLFISELLNLRNQQNKFFKNIRILGLINLTLMLLSFSLLVSGLESYLRYFMSVAYLNFAATLIVLVYVTLKNYTLQKSKVNYILFAFLPNFIWIIILILKAFKLTPKEANLEWLIYLNIYEISLFGYVLIKNYLQTFQINNDLKLEILSEKEKTNDYITHAQIRERKQISSIIHDKFGSRLAHISNLISLKNEPLVLRNIQELASELRLVSHNIMPKSLESGALLSSLKTHVENLNAGRDDLKIHIDAYDFPELIFEKWTFDLFLISNEIIHNSLKHGHSTEILIELFGYENDYVFQFTDNGRGFEVSTFIKGFGLSNIENRISSYGGTFEINSKPSEGTVVQIGLKRH